MPALEEELRRDALDVLQDALAWRLPAARWATVAAAVDALTVALQTGDMEAVRVAVSDLELAGPVRSQAVGDGGLAGVPTQVRVGITVLMDTLNG